MPVRYFARGPANCCRSWIPDAYARRVQSCNTRAAVARPFCNHTCLRSSFRY